MFRDNRNKSTFNLKNGYDKILNGNLIDPKNNNIAFDYLKKLDEILIESKKIISEKILFLKNMNINNNLKCVSLLRYLLESKCIKIKLQIFKDLFDISISSISQTCKIYKDNYL
jgi:hypothetical protein